jgi:nitrite reductase/ring-hydroxylating ferredoxin subunit
MHAGLFEIKTAKAVGAPCVIDLRTYPVRQDQNVIFVGIHGGA